MMPFSLRFRVMVFTVRSDLPICADICFCVALGSDSMILTTANSSKVQFLHFGGKEVALWVCVD